MPTPVEPLPAYVVGLTLIGAFCFGLVVGWVTYSTLRRAQRGGLSDIATVIGAVAGAAVTGLFPTSTGSFGAYCIGLALGFFGYLIFAWSQPNSPVVAWMGETHFPPAPVFGGGGLPPNAI
jgi:hypothetical protein